MDTIQKNREAALPESAQQRNGAVRSAEAQRSAAGRTRKPEEPKAAQAATEKRRAVAEQKAPAPQKKRPAPEKKAAAAPGKASSEARQKRPAPRQEAPSQKKKAAPKTGNSLLRKPAPAKKAAPKKKTEETARTRPVQQGLPDSVSTKKRAYGNSKPKKKTALVLLNDAVKNSTEKRAEKIKARQAQREKGPVKKSHVQSNAPAVIYTEPQAFNRNRFLIQLLTVTAVVVALVLGLSVFFKVETIAVSGASVYSIEAVQEASGIQTGDNLLTFSHARAAARIKAELNYVNSVRFGIKLPDTVNIIIDEAEVVYAIKNQEGTWWLMNSTGRLIEQTNNANAKKYTQILGVTVSDPLPNEQAVATESAALTETDPNTHETIMVPVSVTGAQRLNAALQIVRALEANDIVGQAANVDVTRLEDIILWYGSRYQVNLGDAANLDYKIDCMNDAILQMSEYQSGILDISFTIWPNQVGYTPFA